MKLNKGYYHEIVDRLSSVQDIIDVVLSQHHVFQKHKKAQKQLDKVQLKLGKLYQEFGSKL
jgi:predicted ATP-dependent protease